MKGGKAGKRIFLAVRLALILALLAGILLLSKNPTVRTETVKEAMRDGVLHEDNRISLFGLEVNPALISAYVVTGAILLAAVLIRIFAIPRFKMIPGKMQTILEKPVEFFSDMARTNSPNKSGFVGAYIFSAGIYIFLSTLFELLGVQAVTTRGASISLPAPIADINGAIAMGVTSYLVILGAGLDHRRSEGHAGCTEGFFPAHIHELPTVRRAFERIAGDGSGVLLHHAELCFAGVCGRDVHAAARGDSDLRFDNPRLHLLRRGDGTPEKENEKGKEGCLK